MVILDRITEKAIILILNYSMFLLKIPKNAIHINLFL